MVEKALWQSLKALVDCDKSIVRIEEEIAQTQAELLKKNQQLVQLDTVLAQQKQAIPVEQKRVNLQELQAQELKAAEERKRTRLDDVKDHKEYKALEREISLLARQRTDQDDELVRRWDQLDKAQKNYDQGLIDHQVQSDLYKEEITGLQTKNPQLAQELQQAHIDRASAAKAIPEEWLAKYERMKHNVPNPIVHVHDTACSACFYTILRQDLAKIKSGGVLVCRNCYRFLYFDQTLELQPQPATP
jgi:predicted  nucleic acid-binding Zn-ribbon protein